MDEKEFYIALAADLKTCNSGNCPHKRLNFLYAIDKILVMEISLQCKQDLLSLKTFMTNCKNPECIITKTFLINRFLKK